MISFYDDLVGLKFKFGAKGPQEWDCYHLTKEIAKRRGFLLPDIESPQSLDLRIKLLSNLKNEYLIKIQKPISFCIVLFNMGVFGGIHVGTVLEDCIHFIHAAAFIKRVRIDRLSSFPFNRCIVDFFELCKTN